MKYDVTFTEQAENDLRGIFEYIPDKTKKLVTVIRVTQAGKPNLQERKWRVLIVQWTIV